MKRLFAAAAISLMIGAVPALSDTIALKDGRVFHGVIKRETSRQVIIETVVANIRTTLTFSKADVAEITRGDLPEPEAPPPPPPRTDKTEAPRKTPAALSEEGLYLVVPIEGAFGDEVANRNKNRV